MDPLLSLAFAVHSNPGVYALLLGSGVSRAAGIPTGWEVVLDLVRKLAALKGENCEPDPERWFVGAFGEAPTYSGLLKQVCRTPAERQQLLRGYFEPSGEIDPAVKQPTMAHNAIAALARTGHVRVILTTNFDRLVERSLEAVGVSPVVISTPDGVDGALPLAHAACTVVKLHGDYLDARIRNTPEELAKYDRRFVRLLDRVFDEYGLITCGWSGQWDEALRAAMLRCKSRRFTTYWALKGDTSDDADRVIAHRAAEVISVTDAEHFFDELRRKVVALSSFDPPHPLSVKTAVATMKRLLAEDRHRIELHDLVTSEVERVMVATSARTMPVSGGATVDDVQRRLSQYESIAEILLRLVATGCRWGARDADYIWTGVLQRLGNWPPTGGTMLWINLRRYVALLTYYVAGISALSATNMGAFRAVVLQPKLRGAEGDGDPGPPLFSLHPQTVLDRDDGQRFLPNGERRHTPVNDHLFEVLREPLRDVIASDEEYDLAFDRFEYVLALLYAHHQLLAGRAATDVWVPSGRFIWKRGGSRAPRIFATMEDEVKEAREGWPLIKSALLPSVTHFTNAAAAVGHHVGRFRGR